MPLHPTWPDLALRLVLAFVASGLIGLDREARRHAAGLRTNILVGLAACLAMMQANLLMAVDGKTPAMFSVFDLMRFPLGILTGVGFIGAGAILKRGDTISGVTTAATLWLTTVVGLCFGGGQLGLGAGGAALALATLFGLRRAEHRWMRIHRAKVVVRTPVGEPPDALPRALSAVACDAELSEQAADHDPKTRRLGYDLTWRWSEKTPSPAALLGLLNDRFEVVSFEVVFEPAR